MPLTAIGQIVRPDTMEDGLASRDSASPASLARLFRSSTVSPGLFSGGRILPNSLPISLIRPGFSGGAEGESGAASGCGDGGRPCSWIPSAGVEGGAACGQTPPHTIISIDSV